MRDRAAKIYLYGEGFDFGEVANNSLGVNASQKNLFGNGIGTFNDRIRDGIRGGSPFTGRTGPAALPPASLPTPMLASINRA